MRNKNIFILSILVCIFLVFRLAVLFSYLDGLYEPEELYRGTIAREIIQGPLMPLWEYLDYKVEYFPGGVLTVGILAVPFFLLFGKTYIALKLVGLTFALGTFILWYIFLDSFFNRRTTVICALLFIFCSPFYTKTSLITWGSHPESNFFTILSLFLFYLIFFKKDRAKEDMLYFYQNNSRYFFFLGLIAGFGLWFVQTYLLTLAYIFLFWFAFDRRFVLRKAFLIFCAAFLLGFSPAIYYALFYKGGVFSINGKSLLADILFCDLHNIPSKLWLLLTYDLPNSLLFENFLNLPRKFLSYSYYPIFIIAFIYLLWINRKDLLILFKSFIYPITLKEIKVMPYALSRESLILTYPLLFFLGYSLSSYSVSPNPWKNPEVWLDYIGYRYMIPVMPFIFVTLGLFLGHLQPKRALFRIVFSMVIILGLIGNLSIISFKNFGRFFQDKGYSYNIIGDKIGLRITQNLKEYIKPFEKLKEDLRYQFYEGLGAGIAWRLRGEEIEEVIRIFDKEIEQKYQPYLYRGWGTLFSPEYPEEFQRAIYIANSIPLEYRANFYEGFGKNMGFSDKISDIDKAVNFINKIDEMYQPYCYRGLGYIIGFEFKSNPEYRLGLINRIGPKYQKFIYEGLHSGMHDR